MELTIRWTRRKYTCRRPGRWLSSHGSTLIHVFRLDVYFHLWYTPAAGVYCASVSKWGSVFCPPLYRYARPEMNVKKINLKPEGSKDGPSHIAPVESTVFARFHSLVAHCSVTRYDDGEARQPGWFTVKTQGAAWIVQIKDPNACAQLQCIGETLDDALALAELLLGADSAPWEIDPWMKRKGGQAKK